MSEGGRYRLGVIADIHAAPANAEPYVWQNLVDLPHSVELLDAGLAWLAEQRLDTLALLGDLTEAAEAESFAVVRERALALGVPILAVPGNCDVDTIDRTLTAFQHIQSDRLVIGPAFLPQMPSGAMELLHLSAEPGTNRLRGVRPKPDPRPTDFRIVLTHFPVLELEPELTAAGFRHSGDLINRAEIESELRALETPVIVLHGHLHIHDARVSGPLLHLSCGALIEPPHLVHVIEFEIEKGRIEIRRRSHSMRDDAVERMPVFAPFEQAWVWDGQRWCERARHPDQRGGTSRPPELMPPFRVSEP